MIDFLIILFVSILIVSMLIFFLRQRNNDEKIYVDNYASLKQYIKNEIEQSINMVATNVGLSSENIEKQLIQRENLRSYIRNACSGDRGARKATFQLVKDKLLQVVTENNLSDFCVFDPTEAEPFTMFESLLYINDSNTQKKLKGNSSVIGLADDGFSNIAEKLELYNDFPKEKLVALYTEQYPMLDFEDKIEIFSQMLYSKLYGLGVIDSLNYQKRGIEEIQLGLRNPQTVAYDYRIALADNTNKTQKSAKDAIDVIFRGTLMPLSFLSFKNDAEMKRVINNLIITCNAGELTVRNPKIVTDTVDGRRITASIPPQSDAWLALIRKFNLSDIILSHLYSNETLVSVLTQLVKSGANISVTGEMETGKTTLLRALVGLTSSKYAIRIIENESFEVNGRIYYPNRNVSSFRIMENLDEESVLALVRKTSGQIFVVGEVNQLSMANLACKLSKIASQLFLSAHYVTTTSMVSDFKDAKIQSGFTNVQLAQKAAVEALCLDVHVVNKKGKRYIEYINEIVPEGENEKYRVVTILKGTLNDEYEVVNKPSSHIYNLAKRNLSENEYDEFEYFWEDCLPDESPAWLTATQKI